MNVKIQRIMSVGVNTFKEISRDKIYFVLFGFSFIMLGLSVVLGGLSVGESQVIILDFTYFTMEIIGALISVFVGITLVHREIEKKTIYNILSKPVKRYEFVLGKFLGLSMALTAVEVLMFFVGMSLLVMKGYSFRTEMLYGLVSIWLEIMIVLACAVLFSVVSTPIIGGMFTLSFYIIGNVIYLVGEIYKVQDTSLNGFWIVYNLLPNFKHFDFNYQIVHLLDFTLIQVLTAWFYGVVYCAMILLVAILSFERKDIA